MNIQINRRQLLSGTGALVVSVVVPGIAAEAAGSEGLAQRPPLKPDQLASYISVNADGTAVCWFGKVDCGQGTDIGIIQMVADELDLPADRVEIVMGDTATTVNLGGASGSTGVQEGGKQIRNAAAEARRILVGMAADKLGVPADQLTVNDGIISAKSDPSKKVSYVDLIGGHYFDVKLTWNGKIGNPLQISGEAKPKSPSEYKVIGTEVRRRDVAPKVLGTAQFVVDVKVPGMLHARSIRAPVAGAIPTAVDETSIKDIPGVQIVRQNGLLAVVAPREWDAIRASKALKVKWSQVAPPFPRQEALYETIRNAKTMKRTVAADKGDIDAAFANAAKVVEADYEWPYQSHASMGPACAVADVRDDGATVWTASQKPHYSADGVAAILGIPSEKVHAIWVWGSGSYGRNDAGDVVVEAAVLSKAVGKPVRLQAMRNEGTGWDPKAPASVHTARAALDKDGNVLAWDFLSKGYSAVEVNSNESFPGDTLVGQLLDKPLKPEWVFSVPEESYNFAAKRKAWEAVAPTIDRGSPLRTSHMRDPLGPQIHFASESFIDEVALAIGMDPVEFRIQHLAEPRDVAVVKTAAEKAGWQKRTAARKQADGDILKGQGIAYSARGSTKVAIVAEVEVNRKTGMVWPRKVTVAHDCGLIVNPLALRHTIEGNVVQGASRAIWEEVNFDQSNVTSVDWKTYPTIDIGQAPETIDVILINHPEIPPSGAGEPSSRPMAAAIANAIYDATGVRLRQAPFTPERLKAGMA
ncbi:MAG TPA: molybdopterin cofactor-binding domain-containing protein [Beijerinckiaceae bacterium]|nr:molybdopterin cofactor-binding domain-containing protein [Beijerinckiaceae bacterium]